MAKVELRMAEKVRSRCALDAALESDGTMCCMYKM